MSSNTPDSQPRDIPDFSFEEALKHLEKIVEDLESGSVPLAQSIDMYERGVALKKQCEHILKQAQMRVESLQLSSDGSLKGMSSFPVEPE